MKRVIRFSGILFLVILFTGGPACSQEHDDMLFYKHIALSAWNGVYYGLAADHIFDIQDEAAVALPVITAGTLALIPLLTNESRTISSNQLLLTGHGQLIGWAHGGSLGLLINGDNAFDEGKSKLTVGLAALTSIGLGITGKKLATTMDWSEGRVALYRHYGLVMPATGACLALALSDNARVFGSSIILFGAGGYLLADRINTWNEFTRGEMRATQALTVMNGTLGICIFADIVEDDFDIKKAGWLLPAIGLISGTGVGHIWLKDSNMTPQQGMTTIYAAGLGSLIGVGLAILIGTDEFNATDYLLPYFTGLGTYALTVGKIKSKNTLQTNVLLKNSRFNWDFSFMPQNLYLNNKIVENGNLLNNRLVGMQPLFSASCTF